MPSDKPVASLAAEVNPNRSQGELVSPFCTTEVFDQRKKEMCIYLYIVKESLCIFEFSKLRQVTLFFITIIIMIEIIIIIINIMIFIFYFLQCHSFYLCQLT